MFQTLQYQVLRPTFLLIGLMMCTGAFTQSQWEFKGEKDQVKVYYRRTSNVHEVKLITSIQTTASDLIHLLGEVPGYPKWGYKVVESRLLKKVSDTEMYYHSKLDFPWPLDDRDVVMHTLLTQDPVTKTITATSTAVPDFIPAVPGYLRMRNSNTQWTIMSGVNGWLYVEYYINSSPGGSIPDWLVNAAIDVGPRETIKSLRSLLKQPKYQNKRLAYIKE
jgi:START domain